jgi:predicted TIM-barrel fold metal-dependent hydrolase
MSEILNRRKFFKDTAFSTAGLIIGCNLKSLSDKSTPNTSSYNIMKEVRRYRKINSHEHVGLSSSTLEYQIDFADRLGMEKLVISKPITRGTREEAKPEMFRENNNQVLKAMKQFPDRYLGQFTLNPFYLKESLEEIKRCVDMGMVGLKLYNQVRIDEPLFYPIIEKLIDLKMIILMHSFYAIGVGGVRTKYGNTQPYVSLPENFVNIAKRYPEAMFQYSHTGGGGDWEYACKILKDSPNVYIDTSGSNNEWNMVDFALKHVGEDRLFFGTDSSYYQGVGAILSSKLNDTQKRKIFFENYNKVLMKSGNHVN